MKLVRGNYAVERDCCTSGNCGDCSEKHGSNPRPYGVKNRVIQVDGLSKITAARVAANWARFNATVLPMAEAGRKADPIAPLSTEDRNARIAEAVDDMARPDQPLSVQDHAQNVLARAGLMTN